MQADEWREILSKLRRRYKFRKFKKLKMNSIVKENVNFWEEDIFINNDLKETVLKIEKDILPIKADMKLNYVKTANK